TELEHRLSALGAPIEQIRLGDVGPASRLVPGPGIDEGKHAQLARQHLGQTLGERATQLRELARSVELPAMSSNERNGPDRQRVLALADRVLEPDLPLALSVLGCEREPARTELR